MPHNAGEAGARGDSQASTQHSARERDAGYAAGPGSAWTLISYRLPPDDGRARIAIWRQVRRSGALHLQQSLVAFPDHSAFNAAISDFRATVERIGGQTIALAAQPLESTDGERLRDQWNDARGDEYRELEGKCRAFLTEIEHEFAIEKFTLAELEEEEAELDKLERWHERIATRDIHCAPSAAPAAAALDDARAALQRYADAVYEHTRPDRSHPAPAQPPEHRSLLAEPEPRSG